METKEKIEFAGLPLAVYREIAAHLRQVEGVEVSLVPQSSQEFDYYQSQIDSCVFLAKQTLAPIVGNVYSKF